MTPPGVRRALEPFFFADPSDDALRILLFSDRPLGKPGYSTGVELRLASEHPRMDRDYSGAYKHFGGKD
jgi:hypothetical protein